LDLPSTAVVEVLRFLLPGFIAAWVYYTLTPAPRQIPFERVIQALILTMIVQVLLVGISATTEWIGRAARPLGEWTPNTQLVWSVAIALLLGLFLAWATNRDKLHGCLRKLGVTDQTSYTSEWYGALSQNKGYVVLHLKGSRRLYGWPEEWPSVADRGHFVMANAEWLEGDQRLALTGVQHIVIPAGEVEMVELMSVVDSSAEEASDGRA
jgi:Family of unknown function (DUF6338)